MIQFDLVPWLEIGPLRVSPDGMGTAVGFLACARLLLPATRERGIDDDLVYTMFWRALLGALIGAGLAFVVNQPGEFDNVGEVLAAWEGGLSVPGGIAGGIALARLPWGEASTRPRNTTWSASRHCSSCSWPLGVASAGRASTSSSSSAHSDAEPAGEPLRQPAGAPDRTSGHQAMPRRPVMMSCGYPVSVSFGVAEEVPGARLRDEQGRLPEAPAAH